MSSLSIFADNNISINNNAYVSLFNQAIESDGFYAQQASLLLSEKFINNPRKFIAQLSEYTSDIELKNKIIGLTSDSLYFDHNSKYNEVITNLLSVKDMSKVEIDLINELSKMLKNIDTEVKEYEKLDKKSFGELNYPKFSPVKLDQYFYSTEIDEELQAKINIAFAADPEYFVKRLSKETSDKITKISKIISNEYLLSKNIKLKERFEGLNVSQKEKQVLDILSNNIGKSSKQANDIEQVEKSITASISGEWEIYVYMHVHAYGDRDYPGQGLVLYKPDGYSYWAVPNGTILCRSASGADPTVSEGNTPSGTYTGELYGPVSPSSSYGPYKLIKTTPVSGQVVDAGRSGIWIHGGDPSTNTNATWYPLRPTYGCVRVKNADQNTLAVKVQELINLGADKVGTVYMFEWD